MSGSSKFLLFGVALVYLIYSLDVCATSVFISAPGNSCMLVFDAEDYFLTASSTEEKIEYLRNPKCEEYWLQNAGVDGVIKVSDVRGVNIHHPEEILSVVIDGEEFRLYSEPNINSQKLVTIVDKASRLAWNNVSSEAFFRIQIWLLVTCAFITFSIVTGKLGSRIDIKSLVD